MRIKSIKSNMTELHLNDGTIVLFSYETPVAARTDLGFVRTEERFSVTTSKHITQWLNGRSALSVPQRDIVALTN